jgi:hypothetical protein
MHWQDLGRFLITSHCLGSGSYATVQLALDTTGHQQAACKIIRRKEGNDLRKEMKEATLLMNLNHVRASLDLNLFILIAIILMQTAKYQQSICC